MKTVVIVLGVLILISLGVIVVGVIKKAQDLGESGETITAIAPRGGFGEIQVEAPPGSRLVGVTASGERAILRIRVRDGSDQLVIVDLGSGERLGTLIVAPAPLVQD
jgi:hypothetical protein